MMKTVVHYIDSNLYGGCEQVVSLLFSRLSSSDWRPVLLYHESEGLSRLIDEARNFGVSCRAVAPAASVNRFEMLRQLVHVLRLERARVFHAHLNWPLGCRYGLMAARASGIPKTVATSHLFSPPTEPIRLHRLKKFIQNSLIDRYIAVSLGVEKDLAGVMGVDKKKISIVYNGVSTDQSRQPPDLTFKSELTNGRPGPLILTPARMHLQKGHRYLLEAAARVPEATFLLAGDGPERQQLHAYHAQLGLGDKVRFLGYRDDIAALMSACDLFVLPSLYEGLPVSVLEAMAAGKPVIATAVGGTDEAIIHGETGLLVPPAEPIHLAEAIIQMISSPETAKKYGDAARERVTKMFSVGSMADGVVRIYDELSSN